MGWIPEADKDGFAAEARRMGCTCDFERPDALDATKAPVKLKAGFFSQIFLPFVEMYGYPVYGEANPSIFMLITYCLLFGIMFGDVGQGAVLVLAGLYMFKKRGMWLGRIVMAVGCSAIVFGFVYGSVFGNEHLLPGFKVLEEGNAMTVLLLSAGVGCVLIVVSAIFNIVTGFRQRDYHKALFSANGHHRRALPRGPGGRRRVHARAGHTGDEQRGLLGVFGAHAALRLVRRAPGRADKRPP